MYLWYVRADRGLGGGQQGGQERRGRASITGRRMTEAEGNRH